MPMKSCPFLYTVCPGSNDPFYIVTHDIKWVTTSWTYSSKYTWKIGHGSLDKKCIMQLKNVSG